MTYELISGSLNTAVSGFESDWFRKDHQGFDELSRRATDDPPAEEAQWTRFVWIMLERNMAALNKVHYSHYSILYWDNLKSLQAFSSWLHDYRPQRQDHRLILFWCAWSAVANLNFRKLHHVVWRQTNAKESGVEGVSRLGPIPTRFLLSEALRMLVKTTLIMFGLSAQSALGFSAAQLSTALSTLLFPINRCSSHGTYLNLRRAHCRISKEKSMATAQVTVGAIFILWLCWTDNKFNIHIHSLLRTAFSITLLVRDHAMTRPPTQQCWWCLDWQSVIFKFSF